nr:hypothetical protein [Tanacetum cinerariifolium]
MLLKQKDPKMSEKKVNTTPVDYAVINQLSQDFKTQFVPQTELSTEQAFWSQNSMNSPEPTPSSRPTKVEVPKELPKVSMEIETINIKLDHRVTKLIAENEHLKQSYKQLYDSIKSLRIRSKEQCDDLVNQSNLKSAKNFDLNASLQEKVLVIIALKDNLRKLKGKAVVDDSVTSHPIDPEMLKVDVAPLAPKLQNNRLVHSDYIRHTQVETATLKEIVEQGKSLNPLNNSLVEETLMLAEESSSKMLLKQKDPKMSEKKVNTTPVDYAVLNQLSQDFKTRFVPQTELSTEQAFWSQNSVNSPEPTPSSRPTKVEVPKVSMVNTSLKKLKHHLASFDVVVKERTLNTNRL